MKRIPSLPILLGLLAVVTAGVLAGSSTAAVASPTGLHGFMLTANESSAVFHQTPSFAWNPTAGAVRYELQLSTAPTFQDNGVIFDSRTYLTPVAAPALSLPWITGAAHSLYARVRAILAGGGTSPWSSNYGFDVVPPAPPTSISSYDGLLRWSPVPGATGYDVWVWETRFDASVNKVVTTSKIVSVNTNVFDEREFYAFHSDQSWIGAVHWRVRATRWDVLGQVNGIPVTTHGAWSPKFVASNAAPVDAPIQLTGTISDTFSNGSPASPAHRLPPAFVWSGNESLDGTPAQLFRVEVFTDSGCLNRVWTSATVASPAAAPRLVGPLALPTNLAELDYADTHMLGDAPEMSSYTADFEKLTPNEQLDPAKPTESVHGSKDKLAVVDPKSVGAPVDLWDQDWPSSGYYWTVIPVAVNATEPVSYIDMELPQDVCAAGRVQRFGISSEPSLTTARGGAFASGLSASGRLVSGSHTAKFYGQPLVAWTPAVDAAAYELQWSRKPYPFRAAGTDLTPATSFVLPLKPGTWYYRVRGFDYNLPTGAQEMAWSNPTKIVVAPPTFRVTR
jgi:hypothetical protein